jgi:CheY-like chemotaxis protein
VELWGVTVAPRGAACTSDLGRLRQILLSVLAFSLRRAAVPSDTHGLVVVRTQYVSDEARAPGAAVPVVLRPRRLSLLQRLRAGSLGSDGTLPASPTPGTPTPGTPRGSFSSVDSLATGRGHLRLAVSDSGPRLSPEELALAMEPLAAAPVSSDTPLLTSGWNFELATTRRLVEQLGGTVEVVAGPLGGCEVVVSVPVGQVDTSTLLQRISSSELVDSESAGRRPDELSPPPPMEKILHTERVRERLDAERVVVAATRPATLELLRQTMDSIGVAVADERLVITAADVLRVAQAAARHKRKLVLDCTAPLLEALRALMHRSDDAGSLALGAEGPRALHAVMQGCVLLVPLLSAQAAARLSARVLVKPFRSAALMQALAEARAGPLDSPVMSMSETLDAAAATLDSAMPGLSVLAREPGDLPRSRSQQPSRTLPLFPLHRHAAMLTGRRVLVADDNTVNVMVLSRLLQRLGAHVVTVGNGEQALTVLMAPSAESRFAAVLMDLHMPVMDGLTATRRLREWERVTGAEHMPVIAVTASIVAEIRDECTAAGMDGFIEKPVALDRLQRELASQLHKRG